MAVWAVELGDAHRGPHGCRRLGPVAAQNRERVRIIGEGEPDHRTGGVHVAWGEGSNGDGVYDRASFRANWQSVTEEREGRSQSPRASLQPQLEHGEREGSAECWSSSWFLVLRSLQGVFCAIPRH